MDIKELIARVKKENLPKGEFAVFGSAVLAVRGIREAPNIDLIVTDSLWKTLREKNKPDEEGFVRFGLVKVSNWWFAPTRKTLPTLIKEAETIEDLPFVRLEEVLDYKTGLNREKDIADVKLIKDYMAGPSNLGIDTYQKLIDVYRMEVEKRLGDKIFAMVLFGSVCRGQAKGDSDIDIFTFFDGNRDEIQAILVDIIVKLREHEEYKALAAKEIYPEIYPFLISKDKKDDLLSVFLDVSDHGIIIKDDGTVLELIKKIKDSGYKRTVLPNGKWVWTNL